MRFTPLALAAVTLLPGCVASSATPLPAPAAAAAAEEPPAGRSFVVRVTSGDRIGVDVDWAIFPDESWPLEGRRDHTPFQLDLPAGRVAVIVRPTNPRRTLEVTLFRRASDGSLKALGPASAPQAIGVVVVEPGDSVPTLLRPADPTRMAATP